MRALFIGGGKSGKSTAAQKLAAALADGGPLYYWATMTPHDGEDEARIQRHRDDRAGMGFTTVERSFSLPDGLAAIAPAGTVLFDSVTACLSEQMFPYGGEMDERAGERVLAELLTVSRCPAHFISGEEGNTREIKNVIVTTPKRTSNPIPMRFRMYFPIVSLLVWYKKSGAPH